ncbi:MAG TPA: lytic transglycosylase domain-containing protein [Candidatus Limnocylindria bacterium]|nr:lytic transglycosylase domain-containing protein [Candidatus Limnocylindria bacterium]
MKWRTRLFLILLSVLIVAFLVDQWRRTHLESSQDKNILAAARKYDVDPALIKAVVWRESRFNPRAHGSKGETGLMQIMENTGLDWAGAQRVPLFSSLTLRDPVQNIDCGTWYLRKSLARYAKTDDPVPYALADYNAGRGNALKWMTGEAVTNSAAFVEQIGFPSTRDYVRAVQQRQQKYAREFEAQK